MEQLQMSSIETVTLGERRHRRLAMLGPAFVAAIAYVDPGNVAANLTAGAEYGYLLVWVLVAANLMAVLIQYLSAKLGFASGRSLPQLLGDRMRPVPRILFWIQAEVVAAATDLAEVIGGALALYLLFGVPLFWGGVVIGLASMLLLSIHTQVGQRSFERVIVGLLIILTIGFCMGLIVNPAPPLDVLSGLVPRFQDSGSVLLAASMLGATVMPHAIYLHSALTRDRFGRAGEESRREFTRMTRWDVASGLALAGTVNVCMLLLAAHNLQGADGTDSIIGAQHAVADALGPVVGVLFSLGLLASGLASTSVGCYAGSEIMGGLLRWNVPLLWRRLVTLVPALAILATGFSPTQSLVISQVVLSFGIPFALIPLVWFTAKREVMRGFLVSRWTTAAACVVAALIIALNAVLIGLTITGA